jgi:hypothetical protein
MNEGVPIDVLEIVSLFVPIVRGFRGFENAGVEGCLAGYCLGPRVGAQLNERRIRTIEWLQLVPVVNLYAWVAMGLEAYNGTTMTEIETLEGLRK